MGYRIKVNPEKCIGCGICPSICADSFEMGDDEKAHVKKEVVDDLTCEKDAEEACPTQAIIVEEINTADT